MTPADKNLPPLDEGLLDLLVDGELSEAQRRDLLASLDKSPSPEGWRRCALAFLEAQCWKQDFSAVVPQRSEKPVSQRPPELAAHTPASGRKSQAKRFGTFLAVAASFLIALGIGTQIRLDWRSDRASGLQPPRIAEVAGRPDDGVGSRRQAESRQSWQPVTLVSQEDPGRAVQLPAKESDRWDADCWHDDMPAMPDELMRALKRAGHEVRRSRQFVAVPLEDGRQLFVPVDQVDVRRNGIHDYQ